MIIASIPWRIARNDSSEDSFKNKYFVFMFFILYTALSVFVSSSFAILDYAKDHIDNNLVRRTAELLLKKLAPKSIFTCDQHSEEGFKIASRTVVNIFYYNKKQKICRDDVRKEDVKSFKKGQRSKTLHDYHSYAMDQKNFFLYWRIKYNYNIYHFIFIYINEIWNEMADLSFLLECLYYYSCAHICIFFLLTNFTHMFA